MMKNSGKKPNISGSLNQKKYDEHGILIIDINTVSLEEKSSILRLIRLWKDEENRKQLHRLANIKYNQNKI